MKHQAEQLLESGLGDYSLNQIKWLNEGNNLLMVFQSPEKSENLSLLFVWVTHLCINLNFSEHMGEPLLFQSSLKKLSSTNLKVEFDFAGAPEGNIKFNCSKVIHQ